MTKASYPSLTSAQCLAFAVRTQRADLLRLPPKLQAERIARIKRLVEAEVARGQVQPSWLRQHYQEIIR